MDTKISKELLKSLPIGVVDAVRLLMECVEGLGERAQGLEREELMQLVR